MTYSQTIELSQHNVYFHLGNPDTDEYLAKRYICITFSNLHYHMTYCTVVEMPVHVRPGRLAVVSLRLVN